MDGVEDEYSEDELESLAANLANRPPSDTEADFLDKVGGDKNWTTKDKFLRKLH